MGRILRRLLPDSAVRKLRRLTRTTPVGRVNLGDLRRLTPVSREWGFDRGQPIDRYYLEKFLDSHSADIRERVLEIGGNTYTRRFGGTRVTRSDVLHVAHSSPEVTIVADLSKGEGIPSAAFDCVILTQTLQVIYDTPATLRNLHRILRPGGVALVSFPGIGKISRQDMDRWGYCWSFTTFSARRLFEEAFPDGEIEIAAHGNVLSATAFLHGLAAEELAQEELDHLDPDYEVLITVRARRADEAA